MQYRLAVKDNPSMHCVPGQGIVARVITSALYKRPAHNLCAAMDQAYMVNHYWIWIRRTIPMLMATKACAALL